MESEKTVYSNLSDAMLLKHLKKSDKLALTEIFERYWKKIYNESYKKIKNFVLVESITQSVFVSLWEERENKKTQRLPTYLLSTMRFHILKLYNEGKAEPRFEQGSNPLILTAIHTGLN